jgi:hypothetical protein
MSNRCIGVPTDFVSFPGAYYAEDVESKYKQLDFGTAWMDLSESHTDSGLQSIGRALTIRGTTATTSTLVLKYGRDDHTGVRRHGRRNHGVLVPAVEQLCLF